MKAGNTCFLWGSSQFCAVPQLVLPPRATGSILWLPHLGHRHCGPMQDLLLLGRRNQSPGFDVTVLQRWVQQVRCEAKHLPIITANGISQEGMALWPCQTAACFQATVLCGGVFCKWLLLWNNRGDSRLCHFSPLDEAKNP